MDNWPREVRTLLEAELANANAEEQRQVEERERVKRESRCQLKVVSASVGKARAYRQKLERTIEDLFESDKKVTKKQLIDRVGKLLLDNPAGIPVDELKPLVQDSLRDDGFELTGAFRHWDKWLRDMQDVRVEDGRYLMVVHQE